MNKKRLLSLLTAVFMLGSMPVYGDSKREDKGDMNLPSKYNLATYQRVTPAREKGQLESQWAISFIDSLESSNITLNDSMEGFSVNNLLTSTSEIYSESFRRKPHETGDLSMAVAYVAAWEGPVNMRRDPYAYKGQVSFIKTKVGMDAQRHVQEVLFLPEREDELDNDLIKECIMKYGGVAASIFRDTSDRCAYHYVNEAITLVGWDDDYPKWKFKEDREGDGAFRVKKSDGTFGYVSYYDTTLGKIGRGNVAMSVASRIDEVDNYDHIYQHDPLGYTMKHTPKSGDTVFFANVFNIDEKKSVKESLRAVSFYTLEEDIDYEIYLGFGVEDGSDIQNMKLIKEGNISLAGYHTVDIEGADEFILQGKIALGIKLISKKGTPSIALESPDGIVKSSARAQAGDSYIKDEDGKFIDITGMYEDTNACIKIFTDDVDGEEDKNEDRFTEIPIIWLKSGVVLGESWDDFKIGDEILEIGGVRPHDMMKNLKDDINWENEDDLRHKAKRYICSKNYLEGMNILNGDDTVDILVRRGKENFVMKVDFPLDQYEEEDKADEVCSWYIEDDGKIAYLKINRWISSDDESFENGKSTIDKVLKKAEKEKIENIAIDIRDAYGEHDDLVKYLSGKIDGKIYIITSDKHSKMNTLFARTMRENEKAILIGEESSIKPDIIVNTGKNDIKSGRDIQLEKLREVISGDGNCIYSKESITIEKGRRIIFRGESDVDMLEFKDYFKILRAPFDLYDIDRIYVESRINGEEFPVFVDEIGGRKYDYDRDDELILPPNLGEETYYLVIKPFDGEKEYRILMNIIGDIEEWARGEIIELDIDAGYEEDRGDFDFIIWNKNKHLKMNFYKEIKKGDIADRIKFTNDGEKIKLDKTKLRESMDNKSMEIFFHEQLPPGEGYKMVIPKDTIEFKDGTKYPVELKLNFVIQKIKGRLRHSFYVPDSKTAFFEPNQPVKYKDLSKIEFVDSKGKKMELKYKSVRKYEDIIRLEFKGDVDMSETYIMTVPEGVLDFKFSGLNQKPIIYKMKLKKIRGWE